jgi:hypothetical protein
MGSKISSSSCFLFERQRKVGGHGIGQFAGIVSAADRLQHLLVIQVLAKFDVLFEQGWLRGSTRASRLRPVFHAVGRSLHNGAEKSVLIGDRNDLGALHAFHQHLDIAVGQLETLHDVDDGTDLKISLGLGSSTEASCWAARKIFLSPAMASSSARTDSRPTTNGVIMYGKMTTSRMGIIGSASCVGFFLRCKAWTLWVAKVFLAGLFEQAPIDFVTLHHFRGDHEVAQFPLRGQVIHHFEHQIFQNHAQSAGSHLALQGEVGDGLRARRRVKRRRTFSNSKSL